MSHSLSEGSKHIKLEQRPSFPLSVILKRQKQLIIRSLPTFAGLSAVEKRISIEVKIRITCNLTWSKKTRFIPSYHRKLVLEMLKRWTIKISSESRELKVTKTSSTKSLTITAGTPGYPRRFQWQTSCIYLIIYCKHDMILKHFLPVISVFKISLLI